MDVIEYKWKRTLYSKTFQVDRNTKKRLISLRQLHYEKDGKLTEINLKPSETKEGWVVETPYYKCEVIRFPFEVKISGTSIRNLDSPDTNFPEACFGRLFFPRCGIEIYFRPEGIDISGKGTWKIDGEVGTEEKQTYNYGPILKDFPEFEKSLPGEVIKTEEVNGNLEVTFRHDPNWLNDNK